MEDLCQRIFNGVCVSFDLDKLFALDELFALDKRFPDSLHCCRSSHERIYSHRFPAKLWVTKPSPCILQLQGTCAADSCSLHTLLPGNSCPSLHHSSVQVVKQLKGISAAYRMTNKQLPTKHSPYVTHILKSLKVSTVEKARQSRCTREKRWSAPMHRRKESHDA
jgi:hypothetical protein